MELDIIAAVVIGGASLAGGRGSVAGTLIGALIMTAVANGCNAQDVARLIYRRDALALLEESVVRAHTAARRNFIWHHGELHSGIEMFDGTRTYAQVFPILADEPR
jgi:2-phosphoglycerate kinase